MAWELMQLVSVSPRWLILLVKSLPTCERDSEQGLVAEQE